METILKYGAPFEHFFCPRLDVIQVMNVDGTDIPRTRAARPRTTRIPNQASTSPTALRNAQPLRLSDGREALPSRRLFAGLVLIVPLHAASYIASDADGAVPCPHFTHRLHAATDILVIRLVSTVHVLQ